jgi:hypothetical protein
MMRVHMTFVTTVGPPLDSVTPPQSIARQLLGIHVYMGPPLSCSALSLIIAAGGPASVGLAYKHQAVLALMLFQLYFVLA